MDRKRLVKPPRAKHCARCFKFIDGIHFEKVDVMTTSGKTELFFHDGENENCYEDYIKGTIYISALKPEYENRVITHRQRNFQDKLYPEDQKR